MDRFGVAEVAVDRWHEVDCDILSPCALGGGLNAVTIPALRCRAVAGAANNQLASVADGGLLAERGIVYAPDFVCNAGGVINVAEELVGGGYDRDRALARVEGIQLSVTTVLQTAAAEAVTTEVAAARVAEARIAAIGGVKLVRAGAGAGP